MQNSAEMLLKKMGEDKAFAEKILSQTEREKVIVIAKGAGIELTMEDIDEVNDIIAKALQQKNEVELSEEELENVAGGDIGPISADGYIIGPMSAIGAITGSYTATPFATIKSVTINQ